MKLKSLDWSGFRSGVGKFSAWNKRWLATWWLWGPLLFASIGYLDPGNDRADMYDVARSAPRFVREGVVDDIGIPSRWMQLTMPNGTRRVSCEAARPRTRDTDCLPRERFPLRVKLTLVDYKKHWLIISAADKNGVILSEQEQLGYLKRMSEFSKSRTPGKTFIESFMLGFAVGGPLTLLAFRRRRKLQQAADAANQTE
ncbi:MULTISPECIES: hypothetical protein [Sphingobium]|uniref:hypothetical protein n=1 Tax=Sphingobium TaxID=165695 RepID=UPI0015EC9204|nr:MULTISPECIES: hypothetical protein [Sphingobium]MCW2361633.1 hypothetical protein [Sphingobium sp. B10D3B]MCW2401688.1 hypothetical protein [Sphingobium sp. B10D7B]MCW2408668.1 hypothetical protein [Sphingobium xanthum]